MAPEALPLSQPAKVLPRVARAMRAISVFAAAESIAIGVLVLIGWALDIDRIKRILPGLVAMNPMTAIGFICLGLALALRNRARRLMVVFALVAAAIGAIKVASILAGFDAVIDHILFAAKVDVADRGIPNRIAPNTALNFLLLGVALATLDRSFRRIWPAQFLTAVAAMASLLALTGYAYGVRSFYVIG